MLPDEGGIIPQHRIGPDGSAPNLTRDRAGRRLHTMLGRRALLALMVVVFHVGLATTATLHAVDFAWVPSYFDDDDGDFLPLLLAEQVPTLVAPAAGWLPALTLLGSIAACAPPGRSRLIAARVRFRAPPRA